MRGRSAGAGQRGVQQRGVRVPQPLLRDREAEGVPKYLQLAAILKEKIVKQEYKAEQQIPTEEKLCHQYGVSRITVREAIHRLVQEEFLARKQGKGTYVIPQKLRRDIARVYSFSQDMERLGLKPSSDVLEQQIEQADGETSERLRLPAADQRVTRIRRVRKANGAPVLVESTLVPTYMCPELVNEDLESGSLYAILTERYGLYPRTAEETYEAVVLRRTDAKLLGFAAGEPHAAFAIRRITFLENGAPMELTRSLGRGDRLTLGINMLADKADFQRLVGL